MAASSPWPKTLRARCVEILRAAEVAEKCRLTRRLAEDWWSGALHQGRSSVPPLCVEDSLDLAPRPARSKPEKVRGSLKQKGARAFVHSLAHAEGCAVDCFVDLLARFGHAISAALSPAEESDFVTDVLRIAVEETVHFERLAALLPRYGIRYGDLDAHDALSSSMADTNDDLLARLAVVHLVHEARGLDVFPTGRARLERAGEREVVRVLDLNYADEIGHVKVMLRWFKRFHGGDETAAKEAFFAIVRDRRRWRQQALKPPFNHEARAAAGFDEDWYLPLTLASASASDGNAEEESPPRGGHAVP